jgi:capsular exopolysaccharide synthesis family protein
MDPKQTPPQILNNEPSLDINRIFLVLVRRWYFIVGATLLSLLIAHLKLRYTSPVYLATLTFKLEDEKPNQISDFFRFNKGASGKLENFLRTESEILRSRTLAEKALYAIDYHISYTLKGQVISSELYPNPYFRFDVIHIDSTRIGEIYEVSFLTPTTYDISIFKSASPKKTAHVNDTVYYDRSFFCVRVANPKRLQHAIGKTILCSVNNMDLYASSFANALSVDIEKGTSLLNIQFASEVPQLATDYVNAIAQVYIHETVNNKSLAAQQTVNFIEDLLLEMSNKVKKSEYDLTDFRIENNAIDLDEEAKNDLERLTQLEAEKSVLNLKTKLFENLEKSITDTKGKPVAFVPLDGEDAASLSGMVNLLNTKIIERVSLSAKYAASSPLLIENEKVINELKRGLLSVIKNAREKNEARINYFHERINAINASVNTLPVKQRMLLNIQREFKVNEKVYAYLLEKRLETMINKSSITPNASIIDLALVPDTPISPNTTRTYLMFLLGGLGAGLGLIIVTRILYSKIPDKETIETLSRTPVIGMIKHIDDTSEEAEYDVYVFKSPKSIFAESIRSIRTNINFILKGQKNKSICITSTVSGEGKTFCTINLAAALTMLNYKVVIVGCDLRRPKLHLSFHGMTNDLGLTTYLIGKSTIEDVIVETEYTNLYVVPAGPTPPNPAELLQTDEMKNLDTYLKENFDYVLYDTAPVGLVSDSFPLLKNCDMSLYIFRSQYSKREFAFIPDKLRLDSEIPNLYSILNSYESSSVIYSSIYKTENAGYYGGGGHYYYGGYYAGNTGYYGRRYYSHYYSGYYEEEKKTRAPFWKFWKTKSKKKKK